MLTNDKHLQQHQMLCRVAHVKGIILQVTPAVEAVTVPPVDVYVRPASLKGLPKEVILYQYEVCPFCCKVKAFLDYNQVKFPPTCNEINCAEVVYNCSDCNGCGWMCRYHTELWRSVPCIRRS